MWTCWSRSRVEAAAAPLRQRVGTPAGVHWFVASSSALGLPNNQFIFFTGSLNPNLGQSVLKHGSGVSRPQPVPLWTPLAAGQGAPAFPAQIVPFPSTVLTERRHRELPRGHRWPGDCRGRGSGKVRRGGQEETGGRSGRGSRVAARREEAGRAWLGKFSVEPETPRTPGFSTRCVVGPTPQRVLRGPAGHARQRNSDTCVFGSPPATPSSSHRLPGTLAPKRKLNARCPRALELGFPASESENQQQPRRLPPPA